MFTVLNRLRGTQGLWSKIIGLLLALIVQIAFNNTYVSVAVCLGYIIGESFGWGLWIGCLTEHREATINKTEDEGANNGIQWLSRKIVPNYLDNFVNYCRVALTIRGLYWWIPTLLPLYFVGFSIESLLLAIIVLSLAFPLACELGYRLHYLFSLSWNKDTEQYEIYINQKLRKTFKKKIPFSIKGGWEHQEVWYGLMQDLVLIGSICYVMAH